MVSQIPNGGEIWQMPQVPIDAFDFRTIFQDSTNEIIERIYPGTPFEVDPELPFILLLIGGSNVGKDIAMNPLIAKGVLTHVVTGTSREMRTKGSRAEKGHEYVWFDRPTEQERAEIEELEKLPHEERTEEKLPEYIRAMISKFELVEWDVHHGNLYGLPKKSLDDAVKRGGIPVVRTESNGASTIKGNLKGKYNSLVIGVLPDSYGQIWDRLKQDTDLPYHLAVKRFEDSVEINNQLPGLVHFYLHNSEVASPDGLVGSEATSRALDRLLSLVVINKGGVRIGIVPPAYLN